VTPTRAGRPTAVVFDIARIKRVLARFLRAPIKLQHVDEEVARLRQDLMVMHADVQSLVSAISSVAAAVDVSALSTLEALALANRSIEALNVRIDKLERELDRRVP
jgi:hypothetical protein